MYGFACCHTGEAYKLDLHLGILEPNSSGNALPGSGPAVVWTENTNASIYANLRMYACKHAYTLGHVHAHSCMHMLFCICTRFTRTCTHTHTYTCMHMHTLHMHACTHMHALHTHIRIHVHVRAHISICMFAQTRFF